MALQDAQFAEARTREERDALRAKVAELREEIRELEHEKHCEKLRADALAVSRTKWKASAEAMEEALCTAHAALAKARAKERTEREKVEGLSVESAALPPVDSAEPREVCAGGFQGSGRNAASPLGTDKNVCSPLDGMFVWCEWVKENGQWKQVIADGKKV